MSKFAKRRSPNLCGKKSFSFSAREKVRRKCWWNRPLVVDLSSSFCVLSSHYSHCPKILKVVTFQRKAKKYKLLNGNIFDLKVRRDLQKKFKNFIFFEARKTSCNVRNRDIFWPPCLKPATISNTACLFGTTNERKSVSNMKPKNCSLKNSAFKNGGAFKRNLSQFCF